MSRATPKLRWISFLVWRSRLDRYVSDAFVCCWIADFDLDVAFARFCISQFIEGPLD